MSMSMIIMTMLARYYVAEAVWKREGVDNNGGYYQSQVYAMCDKVLVCLVLGYIVTDSMMPIVLIIISLVPFQG